MKYRLDRKKIQLEEDNRKYHQLKMDIGDPTPHNAVRIQPGSTKWSTKSIISYIIILFIVMILYMYLSKVNNITRERFS